MNKDEIRQTLSGYRPELYSDSDPLIAESLQAARQDPELAHWLEQEAATDRQITAAVAQVAPPLGAREALLEANTKSVNNKPSAPTPGPQATRRYWSRSAWAIAALLLLGATALVRYFAFPPPVEFAVASELNNETVREQMAFFASQRFTLDQTFKSNAESAAWLEREDYPTLHEISTPLLTYKGMGCKRIDWQGRKVGLICLQNEKKELIHLFVVARDDLQIPAGAETEFAKMLVRHERETLGWMNDEQVFVAVASKPGVKIGNLL